jgi:hypothetical protein
MMKRIVEGQEEEMIPIEKKKGRIGKRERFWENLKLGWMG